MNTKEKIKNLVDFTEELRVATISTKSEEVYTMQKRAYETCLQLLEEGADR